MYFLKTQTTRIENLEVKDKVSTENKRTHKGRERLKPHDKDIISHDLKSSMYINV